MSLRYKDILALKIKKHYHIFKKIGSVYCDAADFLINLCLNDWTDIRQKHMKLQKGNKKYGIMGYL